MVKTIDFTAPSWGHAIAGGTFKGEPAPGLLARFKDWREGAYRGSFLCHSAAVIEVGDFVRWKAGAGHTVTAEVSRVDRKRDPSDMYDVAVRVRPGRE